MDLILFHPQTDLPFFSIILPNIARITEAKMTKKKLTSIISQYPKELFRPIDKAIITIRKESKAFTPSFFMNK